MFNEFIFFFHLLVNIVFLFYSLRKGKFYLQLFHIFQIFFANFFVYKQIHIFTFDVTASDVFAIGAFLSLNLLREFFGKNVAQKAIWSSFFAMVLYVVMGQIHLTYFPNVYDQSQSAYLFLLKPSVRLILASLTTFIVVQKIDLYLFQIFKKLWPNNLPFRVFLCLAITNMLDTVLFSYLGLYNVVHELLPLIIVSYCIKMCITAFSTPFLHFSKRVVKNAPFTLKNMEQNRSF